MFQNITDFIADRASLVIDGRKDFFTYAIGSLIIAVFAAFGTTGTIEGLTTVGLLAIIAILTAIILVVSLLISFVVALLV